MKIRTKISLSLAFCILVLFITVALVLKQLNSIEYYRQQASLSQAELIQITDYRAKVRSRLLAYYEVFLEPAKMHFNKSEMIDIPSGNLEEDKSIAELVQASEELKVKFNSVESAFLKGKLDQSKALLMDAKFSFDTNFIPKIASVIAIKEKYNNRNSIILKENIYAMKRNLIFLTSMGLLVTIFIAITLSRFLKRKFSSLELATIEIGKGNNSYRMQVLDDDELTKVSLSFNHMLEALKIGQDLNLQQQQQIMLASKATALGEVASGMGHEINNPLAIVLVSTSLLKKRLEKGNTDQSLNLELIGEVNEAANRISKIVNGIRMISRNAEGDPFAKVSLSRLINDCIELCQQKFAQNDIVLKFTNHIVPENSDVIECRSVELMQVLINILNNAFDAVENLKDKWVLIELNSTEKNFIIDITDSGLGISIDIQEKMMNPFFTTKEVGRGTGLGLTISRGVILKYHGQLELDNSSPNTKFVIILPRQQV